MTVPTGELIAAFPDVATADIRDFLGFGTNVVYARYPRPPRNTAVSKYVEMLFKKRLSIRGRSMNVRHVHLVVEERERWFDHSHDGVVRRNTIEFVLNCDEK